MANETGRMCLSVGILVANAFSVQNIEGGIYLHLDLWSVLCFWPQLDPKDDILGLL